MATLVPAQTIPRRIMSVTSIRRRVTLPNGDQIMAPVGWTAHCHDCNWTAVFMLHQYTEACRTTRSHDCYRGKDKR